MTKIELDLKRYIPLDKSWIIRMGMQDLYWGIVFDEKRKTILDVFQEMEKNGEKFPDDIHSLYKFAKQWRSQIGRTEFDVDQSGTLYRMAHTMLRMKLDRRPINASGTLLNRIKTMVIPEDIVLMQGALTELLDKRYNTSQWASAAVLFRDHSPDRIDCMPVKLSLSYEAREHWQRNIGNWEIRRDQTLERQYSAFLDYLQTGKMQFEAEHSEDAIFAVVFDTLSLEKAKNIFPSLTGHETNRFLELERIIPNLKKKDEVLDSLDHRIVQAQALYKTAYGIGYSIADPKVVNKSNPYFIDLVNEIKRQI